MGKWAHARFLRCDRPRLPLTSILNACRAGYAPILDDKVSVSVLVEIALI